MNYDNQLEVYSCDGIRLDVGPKRGSVTGIHAHNDEYQFEVLLSGQSYSTLKNNGRKIQPGVIDVYNPGDLHEVHYQTTESFIFHVRGDVIADIYREMKPPYQQPVFKASQDKPLRVPTHLLCNEIAHLKMLKEPSKTGTTLEVYKEGKVLLLLRLILSELGDTIKHLDTVDSDSKYKVEKAQKWILKNFHQDDISITRLAQVSHLSAFHFIRVFKNVYGKTPYDYLMEIRVKEALKLMQEGKFRNRESVGMSVGFRNAAQLRYHIKKLKLFNSKLS